MKLLHFLILAFAGTICVPALPAAELSFEYDRARPLDLKETSSRKVGDASVREVDYAALDGRNAATIISREPATGPRPAILFVHWYGPPAPTSNRTQFIPDALALANEGAISLLINTPWSDPEYFRRRTRDGDYARSVQEVKELRRALDLLLSLPQVDPARVAFVGHDFGAMYGAVAAACDDRTKAFVFMAGTQSFSDWFLYGKPRLTGKERQDFVDQLAPLDPVRWLPKLKVPILFQFADQDEHVPPSRATALAAAANEPKTVRTYSADHALSAEATRERIAWLKKTLWK